MRSGQDRLDVPPPAACRPHAGRVPQHAAAMASTPWLACCGWEPPSWERLAHCLPACFCLEARGSPGPAAPAACCCKTCRGARPETTAIFMLLGYTVRSASIQFFSPFFSPLQIESTLANLYPNNTSLQVEAPGSRCEVADAAPVRSANLCLLSVCYSAAGRGRSGPRVGECVSVYFGSKTRAAPAAPQQRVPDYKFLSATFPIISFSSNLWE